MINIRFRNISSFKNEDNDPMRDSFHKYYMPLVKIKDFNTVIDNKLFFDQPIKNKQENIRKLSKCQGTMIILQETYYIICTIKNIVNLLVYIYQDKQKGLFLLTNNFIS